MARRGVGDAEVVAQAIGGDPPDLDDALRVMAAGTLASGWWMVTSTVRRSAAVSIITGPRGPA